MMRVLGVALVVGALGALGWSLPAQAQTRVVVGDFTGRASLPIRNQAVRGLSDAAGIELVPSDDLESAGGDMEEVSVSALVEGTVARRGRRWLARITVTDAYGNQVAADDFEGRSRRALGLVVNRRIDDRLGDAIRGTGASEPAEAAPSPSPRRSGGGGIRLVVREFDGPGAGTARGLVVEELQARDGISLVPSDRADATARSLDVDLSTAAGREAVARALRVDGFVEGEVDRRGRRAYTATVRVMNGLDGELLEEATFRGRSARRLVARLRADLWSRLGASMQATHAPEALEGDGGGDEDLRELSSGGDEDDDDLGDEPSGDRPPAFAMSASLRVLNRRLSYKDDIFGQLRAYQLAAAPAVGVAAEWYPGAHFTDGLAANIGVTFRGEVGVLVQSSDSAGTAFPTDTSSWELGARWRIPLADHELGLELGYLRQAYAIQAANVDNPKPDVPDVDYEAVRLGASGRFQILDGLSLSLGGAWLQVLSAGEIETDVWFPRLDVRGVEAGATVGYALTDDLEAQLSFDWRRYFYTMNPEPGDPWIAGGAADQYLTGSLGVQWVPGGR